MRFHAEHHFDAAVDDVVALLLDPDFHRQVDLPDVARPEVLDHGTDGDEAVLRLRYRYTGTLDPMARRLLGGRELAWVQELRLDRTTHRGRLRFDAEADPRQLHGQADLTLASGNDGHGTVRRFDGELVVAIPLVGGMAERQILPGLLRRLDVEAEALDQRLRTAPDPG